MQPNKITKPKIIKQLAMQKGFTIKELAKELDVDYVYLRNLNSAKGYMPTHMVKKIADYFNLTYEEMTEAITTGNLSNELIQKINVIQNKNNLINENYFILKNFNKIEDLGDRLTIYKLLEVFNLKKILQETKDTLKNDFDIFNYQKQDEDYRNFIKSIIKYLEDLLK